MSGVRAITDAVDDRPAHRGTKRHARLRHDPRRPLLWVGDDDDWKLARAKDQPLVCPEPGCEMELVAVQNDSNKYNPRFFRFKTKAGTCSHWPAAGGGGPESPRHDWLKARLANIARREDYTVTPEHWYTRADVLVHEPQFCLEIQLRGTDFIGRTASRHRKGAQVCWFLAPDVDTKNARDALFNREAVRFRVIDRTDRRSRLSPWDHPGNRDLARRAIIEVYGTVGHAPRPGRQPDPADTRPGVKWWRTSPMDGYRFLVEILAGDRRWYPSNSIGHPTGLWARETDVAAYHQFVQRQRAHRERADRERARHEAEHDSQDGSTSQASTRQADRNPGHADEVREMTAVEQETVPSLAVIAALPQRISIATAATMPSPRPRRRWWQFWRRVQR